MNFFMKTDFSHLFRTAMGLCLCSFLFLGCGKQSAPHMGMPFVPVTAEKVRTQNVSHYMDAIGYTTARRSVTIVPQVDGKIVKIHFKQGTQVKRGQRLYTIDTRPYEAALVQAQGKLKADIAKRALSELQVKRNRELITEHLVAQQTFDSYLAQVEEIKGVIEADEGAVMAAQVNLDNCHICAPIGGQVGTFGVDIGNVVSVAASPTLTTINDINSLYVDFTVAERDFCKLRKFLKKHGLPLIVSAMTDPEKSQTGHLSIMGNTVTRESGTVALRGLLPNDTYLFWPGESVRIRIVLETLHGALLIPEQAVKRGATGDFVFVIDPEKSTASKRLVICGQRQDNDTIVITKGLNAGEQVVVTGQLLLSSGAKVLITNADPAAKQQR